MSTAKKWMGLTIRIDEPIFVVHGGEIMEIRITKSKGNAVGIAIGAPDGFQVRRGSAIEKARPKGGV